MNRIIFISGACGSGKTTLAGALAKHLAQQSGKTVYLIHGDDFHRGFVERDDKGPFFSDGQPSCRALWQDILAFNWDCMLFTADRALEQGLDVVMDYVIEDELPRVRALAQRRGAELYYVVLTAEEAEIERRIRRRGDTELIGRALFLKRKLDAMPENRGHLCDTSGKTPEELIAGWDLEQFRAE